jgi:hypothetical protein
MKDYKSTIFDSFGPLATRTNEQMNNQHAKKNSVSRLLLFEIQIVTKHDLLFCCHRVANHSTPQKMSGNSCPPQLASVLNRAITQ